ncbi:FtsB family cell division protein [Mangrovicoccus algicola]|uniref:Septum formation initiator family protein n=1 Tax=Mangrovicoccus algicola TaxID=2771008 RepID=A0A8J6Z1B9_9RHOB|nr:septum formation initiator family protein [Mangrovicoccus algicola]MBE3639726.1 septum formation initiator family protein [Mangrovicoccus algicola]
MQRSSRPSATFLLYLCIATLLSCYFAYAAVRGDLGVIERLVIDAQLKDLEAEKAALEQQIAQLSNKTLRMSDDYLDLDLLDEQARSVLGMMRSDELVIRESSVSR